jgi:hypothetical protein
MLLRAEHQARVARGETFALNVKAMVERETLAWTGDRFRKAIKVLLEANYLERVVESSNGRNGRIAAQYTLVPRVLTAFESTEQASPI